MLNFKGEIINMKINKYIIGISLIGILSLAGFALASANEKVTTVDGKEVGDVRHDIVKIKHHVLRIAFLYFLFVFKKREVDFVTVLNVCEGNPFTNDGRIVPSLCLFPRKAFLFQFVLNVACGEIDAGRNRIVIFISKFFLDVFSVFGNAQYQFTFVMKFIGKLRIINRCMRL